jgi:hypothetical protein
VSVHAVPRVAGIDRAALVRSGPIVIAGGAREVPACGKWTVAYLKARLGDTVVTHKRSRGRAHPDFAATTRAEMFATGRMRFAELLDVMTTGPREDRARVLFTGDEHFVMRIRDGVVTTSEELAPLLADVVAPALIAHSILYTVWAWFSGPGVRTWLHYDLNACHNLNAQLLGRKRCWLFAPELAPALSLFPKGGDNPAINCSQIDVDDPARRAELDALPRWEAELDEGDLLFIPVDWLHTFEHLGEFNANVNFWWLAGR